MRQDTCKQFIIDALKYRVANKQLTVYGFVIMPNHVHCIWQIHDNIKTEDFQRDFLKFTAKHILNWSSVNDVALYKSLEVKATDRKFQVWERNSLSFDIYNESILVQKLNYLHNNPLQPHWNLCNSPSEYKYSSSNFYETGIDQFGFLKHYKG